MTSNGKSKNVYKNRNKFATNQPIVVNLESRSRDKALGLIANMIVTPEQAAEGVIPVRLINSYFDVFERT